MTFRELLDRHPALCAAAVIMLAALVRLWFVGTGQLNLVQDEAQYWDWTRHLQLTYYSKGPLIAWTIAAGCTLFGNTELGVRIGSIAGSLLTQILLYLWFARGFRRPRTGVLAVFIFNTTIIFAGLGILMTTDNGFTLFWLVCLMALDAAGRPREDGRARNWPFLVLGVGFGLGILAKYTMLGLIGLSGLYWFALVWRREAPRGMFWRLAVALTAGLILGFLPTLIWNFQNHFVGYKHVLYLIGAEGKQAQAFFHLKRVPEHLLAQIGLATPWWLPLMLVGGWQAVRRALNRCATAPSPLAPYDPGARRCLLLAIFFWLVWGFFLLWSFHAKIMPNWTTVSYVAGVALAALTLDRTLWPARGAHGRTRAARIAARCARAAVILSLIMFGIAHTSQYLPLPDRYNPTHRLKGWSDLGRIIDEHRQHDFQDPNKVFIFSGLYDMTAALAFYVPGQPRTYCAWIDSRRMNQYDIWPGPQNKIGWDAIWVLKGQKDTDHPNRHIPEMFARVVGPIYVQTQFDGRPARTFTLYLCYGYNGTWPRQASGKF